jgi:hypothetical protein
MTVVEVFLHVPRSKMAVFAFLGDEIAMSADEINFFVQTIAG